MIPGVIKKNAKNVNKNARNVRILVTDEALLYSPFSPDDEFHSDFKLYIRSKMSVGAYDRRVKMTVLSRVRLDEDKFRRAVADWVREEQALFARKYTETIRLLIGLLAVGSIMILLCLGFRTQSSVLRYSILPVMGSLSLTRAGGILLIDLPTVKATKWLIRELEHNSEIVFEYEEDRRLQDEGRAEAVCSGSV